jgi:hypothetical protein
MSGRFHRLRRVHRSQAHSTCRANHCRAVTFAESVAKLRTDVVRLSKAKAVPFEDEGCALNIAHDDSLEDEA